MHKITSLLSWGTPSDVHPGVYNDSDFVIEFVTIG